jgi:hypothetical protein
MEDCGAGFSRQLSDNHSHLDGTREHMESSDNVIGLTLYSLSGRVAPTGVTLAFRFHPKYLTISPYIYYKGDQQQGTPIGTNENTKGMATQWFGHFLAEFFQRAR